jgi:hypothetical protein
MPISFRIVLFFSGTLISLLKITLFQMCQTLNVDISFGLNLNVGSLCNINLAPFPET